MIFCMVPESMMEVVMSIPYKELSLMGSTRLLVVWRDGLLHTVTSGSNGTPNDLFQSAPGFRQTFQHTFSSVGTFPYYCSVHPSMMYGVITVEAADGSTHSPPMNNCRGC